MSEPERCVYCKKPTLTRWSVDAKHTVAYTRETYEIHLRRCTSCGAGETRIMKFNR